MSDGAHCVVEMGPCVTSVFPCRGLLSLLGFVSLVNSECWTQREAEAHLGDTKKKLLDI